MNRCVVLLRGINVGGRNKVPMAELRSRLERSFGDVRTYIQSGNLVLDSELSPEEVAAMITTALAAGFTLEADPNRVLVIDAATYRQVIADAPEGFGTDPDTYRYDVGFYIGVTASDVEPYLAANPDVDELGIGSSAFYHRRLIARATRSRVARKLLGSPVYGSLTIRNWRTASALAGMLDTPG